MYLTEDYYLEYIKNFKKDTNLYQFIFRSNYIDISISIYN